MILSRSLALTSVLLLTITSSSPALGFVAPFASSRACRAVAFVSQPVPLSDLDAVPSGDDNDVGAEEAAVPFEDADDDSADFKSPSFSKPQRHTLFVGNVPFDKTDGEVRDLFSEFGTVEIVTIPKDKETGSPRGFAFVDMSSPEELKQAVDGLDGREFGGRVLRVQESLPKAEAKKQAKKMVQGSQKLYVGNIDFDATKEDLEELFSEYGEVLDVFIPRHKNSGLPRGFAFVTMDQANAENAIEGANGMEFMGRKMIVNKPLPPGERIQRSRTARKKMYVGNLSFYTTQDTLREVFEEFGTVYDCFMPEDPATGNAKGFGFITMDSEAADEAIREMDGTCELDGRLIRLNEAKPKSRSPRNTYDEEESGFDDSD